MQLDLTSPPKRTGHPETDGCLVIGKGDNAGQYVTVTCAGRAFGIDVMSVREIRRWSPTTPLPGQFFGASGVMDIRGRVVEVYDLATLVGEHNGTTDTHGKVIVVVALGTEEAAIIVDTVSDIIFVGSEEMRSPPGGVRNEGQVSGLVTSGERLVAILDLAKLLPGYAAPNDHHVPLD